MHNSELFSILAALTIVLVILATVTTTQGQKREASVVGVVDGDSVYQLLPVDAIPAIRAPEFVTGPEAEKQMSANEPVMGLEIDGDVRAYSLWQLDAHEIVNDSFGDLPVAVTW
jgi:hypothetical protein